MRGCPSAVSHGGPLEGGSARVEREQLLLRAVRVEGNEVVTRRRVGSWRRWKGSVVYCVR